MMDANINFGISLAIFGLVFFAYSNWILSNVPLTAFGLACVILGATIALIPSSPVPKKSIRGLVEGSCVNVEALLEEFNAINKAIYLPHKDGHVYAFVPLTSNPKVLSMSDFERMQIRVITSVKGIDGLIVFPPGSELVRLSGLSEGAGIEDALRYVLVDYLEGAEAVRAVSNDDRIVVNIRKPKVKTDFPRFKKVLGSLSCSIAGCVLASCLRAAVMFEDEKETRQGITATFKVLVSG